MKFAVSVLWLIAGAIIGWITGFFGRGLLQVGLERTINAVDVLDLVVTIVLALLISRVIERRQSNERVEKDMLIEAASALKSAVAEIRLHTREYADRNAKADKPSIYLRKMKQVLEAAEELEALAQKCFGEKVSRRDFSSIVDSAKQYFRAATSAFPQKAMTASEFRDSDAAATALISRLRDTIILVNRR